MFAKAHRTELRSATQVAIAGSGNMGVDDGAVRGDRDLQIGEVTRSVEELPMLVGLQGLVPTERRDCFLASEKRVADLTMSHQATVPTRFFSPRCIQMRLPFISGESIVGRPPPPCLTARMSSS